MEDIGKKLYRLVVVFTLLLMVIVVDVQAVQGSSLGNRANELSKNGKVHQERYDEILENLDDYEYVRGFKLTRYVPRDATENGWEDTSKGINSGNLKSVHWYKEGGKWVFSSASAERYERVKDKLGSKGITENKINYGGDERKIIWQMQFDGDVSVEDRKSVMPYKCKAHIQYAGDPFSGAHGFVDWGSVAADVAHNKVFDKHAKLFIAGYGKGDIHDVGGGVRGRHLDLFMDDCDEAMTGGNTQGALVIFEKNKSSIMDGKPVTKEILDEVMSGWKWGEGGGSGGSTGGSGEGSGGSGDKREKFNPFSKQERGRGNAGVDTSSTVLPGEASYVISSSTSSFYNIMRIIMFLMGAGLIVFVSLQIASLAIQSRGIVGVLGGKIDDTLFGSTDTGDNVASSENRIKIVVGNTFLLMIILVLVLGSYYIPIQGRIYMGIEYLLSFLF